MYCVQVLYWYVALTYLVGFVVFTSDPGDGDIQSLPGTLFVLSPITVPMVLVLLALVPYLVILYLVIGFFVRTFNRLTKRKERS